MAFCVTVMVSACLQRYVRPGAPYWLKSHFHGNNDWLVFQWENKAIGSKIADAVDDLHEKSAVWSPMYYGDIEVCTDAEGLACERVMHELRT